MNWSRREMSAESVASTNEPSPAAAAPHLQHHSQNIQNTNQQSSASLPVAYALGRQLLVSAASQATQAAASIAINNPPPSNDAPAAAAFVTRHQPTMSAAAPLVAGEQQQAFADWWDEYWSRQPFPSGYTQSSITLLACFISTIIFLIVVGNLLVCIAIFTEKSLKPTQNWFIASLAVSDMLLGLVVMPFSLARDLMGFWVFGPLWCDIHEAVDVLLTTASINTLCLISLDRYWSITQAVSYLKKRTPRRGAFMIAFVWVFSAAVSLPPLFGWKKQQAPIVVTTPGKPAGNRSTALSSSSSSSSSPNIGDMEYSDNEAATGGPAPISDGADNEGPTTRGQRRRRGRQQQSADELATPVISNPRPRDASSSLAGDTEQRLRRQYGASLYADHDRSPTTTSPTSLLAADQQQAFQLSDYPTCQLSDDLGYVLYSALGSFYIPCAVMVFTYIKIFLAARSRARRAINKQARGGGANKRPGASGGANRRAQGPGPGLGPANKQQLAVQQGCNASTISGQVTSYAGSLSQQSSINNKHDEPVRAATAAPLPIMKGGKIVIVERKKSIAAPTAANHQQQQTCSSLAAIKAAAASKSVPDSDTPTPSPAGPDNRPSVDGQCTLTTSGAKHASPSALNSSASNDSSMITVMHATMADMPQVTRFNFREPAQVVRQKTATCGTLADDDHDDGARKAAALLEAIRKVNANEQQLVSEVLDLESGDEQEKEVADGCPVPDIVVQRRGTEQSQAEAGREPSEPREDVNCCAAAAAGLNATNETCFMTIEEDSDMFEAQTGRTITMVAGNASQRQTSSLAKNQGATIVTMMPAAQAVLCSDAACRSAAGHRQPTQTTRSASSYCGSSMTINDDDDDDDIDECDDDGGGGGDDDDEDDGDEEPLTDECNGYSCSVGYDHYCPDQDLSSTCEHCRECEQQDERQAALAAAAATDSPSARHLSIGEAGLSPARKHRHHHHPQQQQQQQQQQQSQAQRKLQQQQLPRQRHSHHQHEDTAEVQSMIGDDNFSLTEYRSNEDEENSSIVGHDVLDATESRRERLGNESGHNGKRKQSVSGPSASAERKKSSIGFRLARLGSTAPLSNYSGGLIALASSTQQQQQQSGGAGTRNLKALRQNFFLKLNQLTAKSSANKQQQQQQQQGSKSSKKRSSTSPVEGKSSAPSSGTSYEPSYDYATTSNVHSNEYPPLDTTMGDETEQHSSTGDQVEQHRRQQRQNNSPSEGHNKSNKQDLNINGPDSGQQQQQQQQQRNNEIDGKSLPTSDSRRPPTLDGVKFARRGDKTVLLNGGGGGSSSKESPAADLEGGAHIDQMVGRISSGLVSSSRSAAAVGAGAGFVGKSQRFELDNHHSHHHHEPSVAVAAAGGGGGGKKRPTYSSAMISSASVGSGQPPPPSSQRAYLASDNERHKRKLAKARERRATLILGLIMAAFICSWLPFFTFYVLRAVCSSCKENVSPGFEAFIFWMGYCNSAINPIIYTIFNRDFRKAFRKILFRCL